MINAEDNTSKSPSRRSSIEIIDKIYAVMPVETYHPISKIANEAGLDWRTTKRYLELIFHIQSKQKGSWLKKITPGLSHPIYARDRDRQ